MSWGKGAWGSFSWGGYLEEEGNDLIDDLTFRDRLKRIDDNIESQLGGLKRFAEAEIIIDYRPRITKQ